MLVHPLLLRSLRTACQACRHRRLALPGVPGAGGVLHVLHCRAGLRAPAPRLAGRRGVRGAFPAAAGVPVWGRGRLLPAAGATGARSTALVQVMMRGCTSCSWLGAQSCGHVS
jgi:hypothetical protein